MGEKKRRVKRLRKQIIGLEKQADKHRDKVEFEKGRKDTTLDYWRRENKLKNENPQWIMAIRDQRYRELVGRVLSMVALIKAHSVLSRVTILLIYTEAPVAHAKTRAISSRTYQVPQ